MDPKLAELMRALRKEGASHIRVVGCEHHPGYVELVLSFIVKLVAPESEVGKIEEVNF